MATSIAFSPDGKMVEITVLPSTQSVAYSVMLIATGKPLTYGAGRNGGDNATFTADGKHMLLHTEDKVSSVDLSNGKIEDIASGISTPMRGDTFAQGGNLMVAGLMGDFQVIDLKASKTVAAVHANSDYALSTSLSPDGRRLALGTGGKQGLYPWNPGWEAAGAQDVLIFDLGAIKAAGAGESTSKTSAGNLAAKAPPAGSPLPQLSSDIEFYSLPLISRPERSIDADGQQQS